MFRLFCSIAIIAFIFAHSRERPEAGVSDDASRWIERTRTDLTATVLRSEAAQGLLRQSLAPEEKPAWKGAR